SSDVCSSDLDSGGLPVAARLPHTALKASEVIGENFATLTKLRAPKWAVNDHTATGCDRQSNLFNGCVVGLAVSVRIGGIADKSIGIVGPVPRLAFDGCVKATLQVHQEVPAAIRKGQPAGKSHLVGFAVPVRRLGALNPGFETRVILVEH